MADLRCHPSTAAWRAGPQVRVTRWRKQPWVRAATGARPPCCRIVGLSGLLAAAWHTHPQANHAAVLGWHGSTCSLPRSGAGMWPQVAGRMKHRSHSVTRRQDA